LNAVPGTSLEGAREMFRITAICVCACWTLVAASPPRELRVAAGADLQSALDRAQPGDHVLLAAGARFTGSYLLRARAGENEYVTIRTDAADLPGPGVRTGPRWSGRLAVLQSATSKPALRTENGAHHWRIENVEFGPTAGGRGAIIELGAPPPGQRTLQDVAHSLILDRVYVHGDPEAGQLRGVALNSAATQILNSYIADIKAAGSDSQAIAGWNGPGPYHIENNYLEAAGENVMFGGGDPSIDGLVPSDIVIRRNDIVRPVTWRGSKWTIKNLLELKNARNVTIERNTFEHHWAAAQSGYAILFTPRNQEGRATWSVVENVRFLDNVVRHVAAAINISGTDDERESGRTRGVVIAGNRFEDVNGPAWGGNGDFVQIGDGPADVRIENNVVDQTGRIVSVYGSTRGMTVEPFVFRGNTVRHNRYGIIGSNASPGRGTLERFFPGAVIVGNIIAGGDSSQYPAGNRFVSVDEFPKILKP
jgi:hypothetical protein